MAAPWLTIARSYVGLQEIPGKLHNPTIWGWLRSFAGNVKAHWIARKGDEIPWCAVFVSHCLESAGFPSTRDARAVSYATYGKPSKFVAGAIVVLRRRRKSGKNVTGSNRGGYHVFFFDEMKKHFICGYGGNQRNKVSRACYPTKNYEIVAVRWPEAA